MYLVAIPLRNIGVEQVTEALVMMLSCVGVPKEILTTDHGENLCHNCYLNCYNLN